MGSYMRAAVSIFVALFLMLLLRSAGSAQEGSEQTRDPALEGEIYERLEAVNPAAVPIFQTATQDLDAGRLDNARNGYLQVLELAPDFPDANLRLSHIEGELRNYEAAIDYAELALAADDSPWNQAALALALLLGREDPADLARSLSLAVAASAEEPDDISVQYTLLLAGIDNENSEITGQAAQRLAELDPANPAIHYRQHFKPPHD